MIKNQISVLIRVDSSVTIGSGHVTRCLVLAHQLTSNGCRVTFVCRRHAGNLLNVIADQGFDINELDLLEVQEDGYARWIGASWKQDALDVLNIVKQVKADVVVVDHYGLDARWEHEVAKDGSIIVVIDDLANRKHQCQLLLDQNCWPLQEQRYDALLNANAIPLLGEKYALLRNSFALLHQKKVEKKPWVMGFFGGSDPTGECEKLLIAASKFSQLPFCLWVVTGIRPLSQATLTIASNRQDIKVVSTLLDFDEVLARCRYAIGASGSSNWERFCLNVPTTLVSVADNQTQLAEYLSEMQAVRYLGESKSLTDQHYHIELTWLIEHWYEELTKSVIEVDGYGAIRVAEKIMEIVNEKCRVDSTF